MLQRLTSLLDRRRPWQFRAAAVLLAAALTLLAEWAVPTVFSGVEESAGDLTWRLGAQNRAERRIVLVDIDESSLQSVGPWPWPRATVASLAERLTAAGVSMQVYDIGFSDSREGDAALASALRGQAVVLGQAFSLDPAVSPTAGRVAGALQASGCPPFAPQAYGAYGNAAELLEARPAVGHMTPLIEGDGVVRRLPALVCHQGAAYAGLGLTALWRVTQPESLPGPAGALRPDWVWRRAEDAGVLSGWWSPPVWLSSASLPGLTVPLDATGHLRVPYRISRGSFVSIPAAQVLKGQIDPALLKGAIVLVGATAFGIGDVVATPHSAVASGFEVHAQSLAGLLDRRIPYQPRAAGVIQFAFALACAALLLALTATARGRAARRLPLTGVALAALLWFGSSAALLNLDLWLPWAAAGLFSLLCAAALATGEHAQALLQRERLTAHLGAYLPRPVAQRLMTLEPSGVVQAEHRDISVLVADIRNFSAFATHRPPEETVSLLHAFSTIAVDVVERHGGVIERVAGDAVVAVWNAVSPCDDHPEHAMAAARELLTATRPLLSGSRLETGAGPVQPLALGIGLESGLVIVGSFGPARRRAHAALGEAASVASRIQQMTADLSVPILVGPRMAERLQPGATEPLGEYLLEGLGRHYALHVPVAWAELVPVDPAWATAAAGPEHPSDTASWTRWRRSGPSSGALATGLSAAASGLSPRDA